MSFFSTLAESKFAAKCFAVVGLDFAASVKAGDENVIKLAVDAAVTKAVSASKPDLDAAVAEVEKLTAENGKLSATVSAQGTTQAAFESLGYKLSEVSTDGKIDTAKLKIADEKRVSTAAQKFLAASGHPVIADPVVAAPAEAKKAINSSLTGLARVAAATRIAAH